MIALEAHYESRHDLCEHTRDAEPASGLLVEGDDALEFGTPVLVRVTTRGLSGDVTFEGTVCSEPRAGGASLTRVAVAPMHRARFEFLCRWARGMAPAIGAREDRLATPPTPCTVTQMNPVALRESASLMEVSAGGARIACRQRLAPGSTLIIDVRTKDGVEQHLAAMVVWSHTGVTGLSVLRDTDAANSAWERVVAEQRHSLAWLRTRRSSTTSTASPDATLSDAGCYAIVDRDAIRQRRARRSADSWSAPPGNDTCAEPVVPPTAPLRRETLSFEARPARVAPQSGITQKATPDDRANPVAHARVLGAVAPSRK